MDFVDSHQHFWKISRGDYSWMDETTKGIDRDYFPPDLEAHAQSVGVGASIVVQAAPTVAETKFLLSLADRYPVVHGVVGWVDLISKDCATTIERLAKHSKLKGIRPFLEYIPEEEWMIDEQVLANLRIVADAGLTFDALIRPRHFDVMRRFVEALPNLSIVIDHCAKPEIENGRDPGEAWRTAMSDLSEFGNVYCKLSGLATECGVGWTTEKLRPVFDHILDKFGSQRIMWGSDWPVLDLVGTYETWFGSAREMTVDLAADEQAAIFSHTAREFYSI